MRGNRLPYASNSEKNAKNECRATVGEQSARHNKNTDAAIGLC